jgi:hypothetical protein
MVRGRSHITSRSGEFWFQKNVISEKKLDEIREKRIEKQQNKRKDGDSPKTN